MLKNIILPAVFAALSCATPALSFDISDLSEDERASFGEQVRAYLMENPQVIMEAVSALEAQQAQAQAQADITLVSDNAEAIFNDGFSFVGGNPDGDITLVEFMDYRCGYCKRAYNEVEKLLKSDGNIRFIVKEFPILGEQSVLASRYTISAQRALGDEAYKSIHDALMTYNGDITLNALRRVADSFGYDSALIEAGMEDEQITEQIRATRALAQQLRISGTPTFVLADEVLRGYLPYDQMKSILAEKRG